MHRLVQTIRDFFQKGDMVLLLLCLVTNAFGCLVIASTTNTMGAVRYVIIQIAAAAIGVCFYAIISSVDTEFFSEHRSTLVIFNTILLLLLIPFGTDNGTGNRSWLDFPLLPVNIQPAEICKITYILIMASVMSSHQNRISHWKSVFHMVFHLILLVGLNVVLSRDAGVSLIFVFVFIGMAFAGGVHLLWFLLAAGGIALVAPFAWEYVMSDYQKLRLEALWNPEIDPLGTGVRYQANQGLRSLTGGGLMGQGLFQGTRTQTPDALYAQHTDFIFDAIGEEMGYVGCALALVMLVAIIFRCIYVGNRSQDYMRRLVCFGAASALIFQVISNVGMCLGVTPVIGLTLPFISYGGSSIVSLYAMLGLVSGVYARPASTSQERYIRPY
ncbi:MAG: FtsW/RodA/SpoVE family cell cycle protein [Oscillospiraceae bacterium]|nr:FtsW/RodA/SpoVE family cell cycle protein [Oscillospiraceae bacterium]